MDHGANPALNHEIDRLLKKLSKAGARSPCNYERGVFERNCFSASSSKCKPSTTMFEDCITTMADSSTFCGDRDMELMKCLKKNKDSSSSRKCLKEKKRLTLCGEATMMIIKKGLLDKQVWKL